MPLADSPLAVSVVVPTLGRADMLERCLCALLAQDLDPASYEVIVVDDGPSTETRRRIEQSAASCHLTGHSVRYCPVGDSHGPAAARNVGWRNARAQIIAFTDDDCVPDRGWLREGLSAFGRGIAGVSGRVVVPLSDSPTDYERNAAGLEEGEFVTANCFYRRDVLAAVGGFDERFTTAWREDADLFLTLLERGYRLVNAPGAVVVHPVRPAAWGISLRQQPKSVFNALLFKKHPALYRQKIQSAPPWSYYGMVLSLAVTLIGLGIRQNQVAAGAAAAWALLTARFCFKRLRNTTHAPRHVSEMLVTSALIPPMTVFWRLRGALRFRVLFF